MKVLYSWIREFVDVPRIGRSRSAAGCRCADWRSKGSSRGPTAKGDDAVLDFDVTANRPDCLSIAGIAREIATVYDLPLRGDRGSARLARLAADRSPGAGHDRGARTLRSLRRGGCRGRDGAVAGLDAGTSDARVASGRSATSWTSPTTCCSSSATRCTRSISIGWRVRRSACDALGRARVLKTLDGKMRTLTPDTLVIADAERAQAVGGVMGGADSEVHAGTRRIVFESAWFKPASVRATSKRLGLRTEASMRFERGADLTAPARALARACELLVEIGAGGRGDTSKTSIPVRTSRPRCASRRRTHQGVAGHGRPRFVGRPNSAIAGLPGRRTGRWLARDRVRAGGWTSIVRSISSKR